MHQQAERFVRVSFLQEFQRIIGCQLRSITFSLDVFSIRFLTFEFWIVIFSLIPQNLIIVETLGFALHVPLPDNGCLVTMLL